MILEEIDRLDTIISRLLYFARPIQLQLQPVSLDDLCAAHGLDLGGERRSKERSDRLQGCIRTASSSADRGRLLQVLDNLMENAVHSASHSQPREVG